MELILCVTAFAKRDDKQINLHFFVWALMSPKAIPELLQYIGGSFHTGELTLPLFSKIKPINQTQCKFMTCIKELTYSKPSISQRWKTKLSEATVFILISTTRR